MEPFLVLIIISRSFSLQVLRHCVSPGSDEGSQQVENTQNLSRNVDSAYAGGVAVPLLQELPVQHLEPYGKYLPPDLHGQV